MRNTTANKTIEELRKLCASHGLPEQIVRSIGPQFVSEEFTIFTMMNGVKHIKSTTYHPAIEGAVRQTFKKMMKASEHDPFTETINLSTCIQKHAACNHSGNTLLKKLLRTC